VGASGTVSTSGTAVTGSGTSFDASWVNNFITINSVGYKIATVTSPTAMTLATSAGSQTSVSFSMPSAISAPSSTEQFTNNQGGLWTTGAWMYVCATPCTFTAGVVTNGIGLGTANAADSSTQEALSCGTLSNPASGCPAAGTNYYVAAAYGAQAMDIYTGQKVPLISCTGALQAYNLYDPTLPVPAAFGPSGGYYGPYGAYTVTAGSAPWASVTTGSAPNPGFSLSNVTVTFSVPGITQALSSGTTDTSCHIVNIQSSPWNATYNKNLMLANNTYGVNNSQTLSNPINVTGKGPPAALNQIWTDNTIFEAWKTPQTTGQGCSAITFINDVYTAAALTSVAYDGTSVVTIVTPTNPFAVGDSVLFSTVNTASFLTGLTGTITSVTPTGFTATVSLSHAAYGPTADTGWILDSSESNLTNLNNVFPTESSANYTGTPGCSSATNTFLSSFNSFCTNGYWNGSTQACTGGNQNINVADYHSLEPAGGAPSNISNALPNFANIDAAQILNQYPGGFQDVLFSSSGLGMILKYGTAIKNGTTVQY
jgi:hypothetical protein